MNFKGAPEILNVCLMIICFILCYMIFQQVSFLEQINDFPTQSPAIINKYKPALAHGSRYYIEVGKYYYYTWLFLHLARGNQHGMHLRIVNGLPIMMMDNRQMMRMNQSIMMINQMMM